MHDYKAVPSSISIESTLSSTSHEEKTSHSEKLLAFNPSGKAREVVDSKNIVYIVQFLYGFATLLPFQVILSAFDFF